MKYIVILVLVLALVYFYYQSTTSTTSTAAAATAGSAAVPAVTATTAAITGLANASAPVLSSASAAVLGPVGPNGWPLMAPNGISASAAGATQIGETAAGIPVYGIGSNSSSSAANTAAPVLKALPAVGSPAGMSMPAAAPAVLPAQVMQSAPIKALGTSSNGYTSYAGTGTDGKTIVWGTKGSSTVIGAGLGAGTKPTLVINTFDSSSDANALGDDLSASGTASTSTSLSNVGRPVAVSAVVLK